MFCCPVKVQIHFLRVITSQPNFSFAGKKYSGVNEGLVSNSSLCFFIYLAELDIIKKQSQSTQYYQARPACPLCVHRAFQPAEDVFLENKMEKCFAPLKQHDYQVEDEHKDLVFETTSLAHILFNKKSNCFRLLDFFYKITIDPLPRKIYIHKNLVLDLQKFGFRSSLKPIHIPVEPHRAQKSPCSIASSQVQDKDQLVLSSFFLFPEGKYEINTLTSLTSLSYSQRNQESNDLSKPLN